MNAVPLLARLPCVLTLMFITPGTTLFFPLMQITLLRRKLSRLTILVPRRAVCPIIALVSRIGLTPVIGAIVLACFIRKAMVPRWAWVCLVRNPQVTV